MTSDTFTRSDILLTLGMIAGVTGAAVVWILLNLR